MIARPSIQSPAPPASPYREVDGGCDAEGGGNGHTGRALNSLYLIERGLLNLPILYLSRYFIRTRAEYYRLLLEITRGGRWEEWLLYALAGVSETALWTAAELGRFASSCQRPPIMFGRSFRRFTATSW